MVCAQTWRWVSPGRPPPRVLKQAVAVTRPAGQAVSAGGAGGFDQRLDTTSQPCAALQRLSWFALHPQDRGLGQQRLGVPGLARQHVLQIRERGIEVVATLLEHRAQDEHRDRRLGKIPPRRQRRLSVALVARVAFALSECDVSRRQRERPVEPRRLFGKPRPCHRAERAHPWFARRGQLLQNRVVLYPER